MTKYMIIGYIFVVLSVCGLVFAVQSFIKNGFKKSTLLLSILPVCCLILGFYIIYLNPNYSKEDFIKPVATPPGEYYYYTSNPQICLDQNGSIMTCPVWISNNMQIWLMQTEKSDGYFNKIRIYEIVLKYPKAVGKSHNTLYVHTETGILKSFSMGSTDDYCYYGFNWAAFKEMETNGIISISYKTPTGFYKRFDKESLKVINEQLIFFMDYLDNNNR